MLSKRIANITPSATHAMTARIAEKRAAGENIITFSIGEPDFPTPRPIVEACERALREGKTGYTSVNGIAALWRTSVSAWTGWKRRLRDCGKPAGGIRRCR